MYMQTVSESKKPGIMVELQKLVREWPLEVIKRHKEEDRKVPIYISIQFLLKMGLWISWISSIIFKI